MKKLLTLALVLAVLAVLTGPAVAQQQSWSVAIEQNPMLTNCGTTTNIPVAGANSCATAIPAAQNLLTTLLATPNCVVPHCPAGYTMTPGVPSCTSDPYTLPNGQQRTRYQVNLRWNCVPPRVSCATPPPATNYNTGSTSANNVPLNQCYKNTVGECLYNFAAPGTAGGWNTGCPPAIAGSNCCGWTPSPATSCTQDLNSGVLTIGVPTVSNITATSASLTGSVSVTPPPPTGCSYTAKLVWGPPNWTPATGPSATGTIPPPGPLSLSGTASPLNPSSIYGARIEVTKQCGGLAPTTCFGPTKRFETPKDTGKCDLEIKKSLAHMAQHPPFQTGQQVAFEIYVTNQGTGTCSAPISVTDNFSQGLTYVSGGTSGWVCPPGSIAGSGSVTCTYNQPIAPSQTSMFLVSYTVTGPPPNVVGNCVIVKHPNDSNQANNRACIEVPVEKPKLPDLTIKKHMSCPGPTTPQGTKCTITFTITNNGPGTFNGILTVQDSMTPSPSVTWAGGSTPTSTPQGWGWSCGLPLPLGCATTSPVTLAPPGSTTFSVDVYIPAGQYENCANVKGYTQFPYTPSSLVQEVAFNNNQSCVPIQVGPPCKDVTMNLSTGQSPWTVSPGTVGVTSRLSPWVQLGGAGWIQPSTAGSPQLLQGGIFYQYSVPFTLPGPLSQYSSISLNGQYAADNTVHAFFVGPASTGPGGPLCIPANANCFSVGTPFSITAPNAFTPGLSTLTVRVYNNPTSGQGPTYTGLIVDATLRAVCKK